MTFRTMYKLMVIFSILGMFYLIFINEPLVYFLYGYDQNMIRAYTAESFTAFERTLPARRLGFYAVWAWIFLSWIFSFLAMIFEIRFKYYFNYIVFAVSMFFMLILGVASMIPRRGL